jgi:hypothetical protein
MERTKEGIKELLEDMISALGKDVLVEENPSYNDCEDIPENAL